MKGKFGINMFFALIALTLGIAIMRDFNFETFKFKNTLLGILYLIVFITSIYFTFKVKQESNEQ